MKTKRMFFIATMAITRIVLFIWLLINGVLMNITHHQGTSFSFLLQQMQALFLLAHTLGKRRTNIINGYLNLRRSTFSGLARRSTTRKRKRVCWNKSGRNNNWWKCMLSNDTDNEWLKKI